MSISYTGSDFDARFDTEKLICSQLKVACNM